MEMKTLAAGRKTVLCQNADSPFFYFGWPTVTRLPDGTLAMAASGFRLEHVCPFGKGVIAYSKDEGESWTHPAVVIDTPLDDRDCGLTCFGEGKVILTSFNNTTAFQRQCNADRLLSSSAQERAKAELIEAYTRYVDAMGLQETYLGSTYRISEDGGYRFGPVRKSPVTAPHGPCRMLDGVSARTIPLMTAQNPTLNAGTWEQMAKNGNTCPPLKTRRMNMASCTAASRMPFSCRAERFWCISACKGAENTGFSPSTKANP